VYFAWNNERMGDSNERLRKVREKAGFRSARSAALRFGWNPSTYASHENGQTAVPQEAAKAYARAFKSSAAWILTGEGPSGAQNVAKVMGFIGAGGLISPEFEQVPEEGLSEIEAPFPLPDDAIAFQVEGNSMWPRYDPGDVVICRNREADPLSLVGVEVAVRTTKGLRYLKRILRGKSRELFDLESYNAEPIRGVRIAWVSEVNAVIRAGQWQKLDDRGKQKALKRRAAGG
jgi:phage repressor protein C with HTH and peptisase S24 domain